MVNERIVGIMGAMPEEIEGITQLLSDKREISRGQRTYTTGRMGTVSVVVVFSRWGKVAAAITVANLILEFSITELIFTGVAGAIDPRLRIGDIVLGKRLIQHDMDARPLMNRFEIPLLGVTFFTCPDDRLSAATTAIQYLLEKTHLSSAIGAPALTAFGIDAPRLMTGDIASGDKFFASHADKMNLLEIIPSVLCVEMEGAAVAQVCYEYKIPLTIIRTISDTADERSPVDFPSFIKEVSSKYSVEIIKNIFRI